MPAELLTSGSETTLRLSLVVGSYLCASSLGLSRLQNVRAFLADLVSHAGILHAVGAVAFFVGAGILSFHRHWTTLPEIVLNLVALWWVLEGAGLLADPKRLGAAMGHPAAAGWMRRSQACAMAFGVYLLLVGVSGSLR